MLKGGQIRKLYVEEGKDFWETEEEAKKFPNRIILLQFEETAIMS